MTVRDRTDRTYSLAMQLLLRAATAPRDEASEAWATWLGSADLLELGPGATGLLGLVRSNIGPTGALDLSDAAGSGSVGGRVRGVHRQTWAANRVRWNACEPLVDLLGATTTVPMLLGAASTLPTHGGDWGARPMYRAEIALPPSAGEAAREALASTGWAVDHLGPSTIARTRAGLVERWQCRDATGQWLVVRWHILSGISSRIAGEQLWGASWLAKFGSTRVRLLHPADALLELLWRPITEPGPGWVADAVVLARHALDAETGLGVFGDRCRHFGVDQVIRRLLQQASAALPDPAFEIALAALAGSRPRSIAGLWNLPMGLARLGEPLAGHAAGQPLAAGVRSLVRSRAAATLMGQRGIAHRR